MNGGCVVMVAYLIQYIHSQSLILRSTKLSKQSEKRTYEGWKKWWMNNQCLQDEALTVHPII